jgi:lambda family phage portal protein
MLLDAYGNKIPMRASSSSGGFNGASYTRRLGTWGTSSLGPNSVLYSNLNTLRARSRELARNDPTVSGGIDTLVANLIGNGITPRWQLEDSDLKAQIQKLWAQWALEADFDQICDFYGLQTLACRCMVESGEVLIRIIPQRPGALSVPLQLQVIEPDHLDESFNTVANNGNDIRMGIEFDKAGRRVAYHLFKEHPGEFFLSDDTTTRIRVPADQILHIYRPLRPGQKRGRPWLSSVITVLYELGKYLDAEQVRKAGAAMFGGFISTPVAESDSVPNILGVGEDGETGQPDLIALEPGTYPTLPPGYDVKFSEPAEVGGSFEPFVKSCERRIARGFGGLTYEKLTGDLSGVNYSSIRAGNLEFQRLCLQIINNVLAFQLCQPVAQNWLNQAVLSGAIRIPDYSTNKRQYHNIKWCPDGWPWVDPEKDLKAENLAIRNGLKSRTESVAERGRDVEAVDAEIAADNQRADDLGLKYDSDPRQDKATNA